jgi:hypothetical protein
MTTIANFEIHQGETFKRIITIVDNNKVPLNLTNYTYQGQIRKNYNSVEYVQFDIDPVDLVLGKISFSLTYSVTETLIYNKYVYDIEITAQNNIKTRILEGIITTTPNVTR